MKTTEIKTIDLEGIKAKLLKEDKSGLAYVISHLVPANTYWSIALITSDHKKIELREKVFSLEEKFYKLEDFQTYKQFFK